MSRSTIGRSVSEARTGSPWHQDRLINTHARRLILGIFLITNCEYQPLTKYLNHNLTHEAFIIIIIIIIISPSCVTVNSISLGCGQNRTSEDVILGFEKHKVIFFSSSSASLEFSVQRCQCMNKSMQIRCHNQSKRSTTTLSACWAIPCSVLTPKLRNTFSIVRDGPADLILQLCTTELMFAVEVH